MQSYDQKYFDTKANKRAGRTWLILMFVVTGYYGIKMLQGEVTSGWFAVFSAVGWFEYLSGSILLKVKGAAEASYKWLLIVPNLLQERCLVSTYGCYC